jgi:hypothetical protein
LHHEREAITKVQGIIVIVVVLVAAGVAGVFLLNPGKSPPNSSPSGPIVLAIEESNPVTQADSFQPSNITASHGTTITLAVQNNDDQARTFEIKAFSVNQTIGSGTTDRISVTIGQTGVYQMLVPSTPGDPASNVRPSPAITGYLIVS